MVTLGTLPTKVVGPITQLKSIYTTVCSMGNRQEEWEAIAKKENYDIVVIMETCWDDSQNRSAAIDGYKLFRRDRGGRRWGGVALSVRECLHCLELNDGDDRTECLRVRIRGKGNKAHVLVGVCSDYSIRMKCFISSQEKSHNP